MARYSATVLCAPVFGGERQMTDSSRAVRLHNRELAPPICRLPPLSSPLRSKRRLNLVKLLRMLIAS